MALPLAAQSAADIAAPAPPATQPASDALDSPYADGSFGFSVRPPVGCTILREKLIADGDVEVVRFINMASQWSVAVRIANTDKPLDADSIIDEITRKLAKQQADVKVLRGEPGRVAGRDGVRYAASFRAESAPATEWLRLQAVVAVQPTEYFALVMIAPLNARGVVEPMFERVVASFEIIRDDKTRERIEKAMESGKDLLSRVSSGDLSITGRVFEDTYYLWILAGKDIGFVRVSERPHTQDHRDGLQIREWGWRFDAEGKNATHLQHDLFLAANLSFERWANWVYAVPLGGEGARQILVDMDNAIRQGQQLAVAYLPQPNAPESREKVIELQKSYAPASWNVLFPRLVDLDKAGLYAFSVYDGGRRGLTLRTLEVVGPAQTVVDGRVVSAIKIEDSEGLIPPKTEIYVGRDGRILRVVVDKLEMVATDAKTIESKFGTKVAEAQNLLKQLQPPKQLPNRKAVPPGTPSPPARIPREERKRPNAR